MTPLERIRAQLTVMNERREKVLRWRSDDFGHDTQSLMEAESIELQNIGNEHELLAQAVERMTSVLDEIDLGGRGFYQGAACSSLAREALDDVAELMKGVGK